jgi:hypothetical protein
VNASPQQDQQLSDERLEEAIESTRQALLGAHTRAMQADLERKMRELIGQRSRAQIERMEQEKGLTR